MGEAAQVLSNNVAEGGVASGAAKPQSQWRGMWLVWFVAACMAVLAYCAREQLRIQQRILVGSQELAGAVGEAGLVSEATNVQLGKVKELDAATARLEQKLQELGQENGRIKEELAALQRTIGAIHEATEVLDQQALKSYETLRVVVAESDRLRATLVETRAASKEVTEFLAKLVDVQEAVKVDLDAMERKTRFLDALSGGGSP